MFPVIIFVCVAVPLIVIAFFALRRRRTEAEQVPAEEQAELEREFADAERYQEQWREEQAKHPQDESLY